MKRLSNIGLCICLLLVASTSWAQSVATSNRTTKTAPSSAIFEGKRVFVDGQVDKVKMYIGDVVTYKMTTRHPEKMEVGTSYAGRLLNAAGFEIRDFKEPQREKINEEIVETRSFTFSTFTTGAYVIPPIPVQLKHEDGRSIQLATMPLRIDVVPVPRRPGEPDDIRDIKGTLSFAKPALWPWILGIVVILVFVAAVVIYLVTRTPVTEEVIYTPLDAYEDAIARLRDLRQRRDSGEVDVKTYHYGFAEILRIYLEGRFAFTSLSETTSELISGLKNHDFAEKEIKVIEQLLEESDLVKFARYSPSASETADHDSALDAFLERTKPVPEEVIADDEEIVIEDEEEVAA